MTLANNGILIYALLMALGVASYVYAAVVLMRMWAGRLP